MKRFLSAVLCLTLLLVLAAPLCAFAAGPGWYEVNSSDPYGYCYLYLEPSDSSRNLGRYDNGTRVYVQNYNGGKEGKYNYCRVQTMDGKTGYMHDYALTPVPYASSSSPSSSSSSDYFDSARAYDLYVVSSDDPVGYCYLYSQPSDRDEISRNLGRYDNGAYVYVLEYYGGRDGNFNYCRVQTMDGKTGYMHDYALTPYADVVDANVYVVSSSDPYGYCYLYSMASDRNELGSQNLGRYDNGTRVYVLEYWGGQDGSYNYCRVKTMDGKFGYMHDYALRKVW